MKKIIMTPTRISSSLFSALLATALFGGGSALAADNLLVKAKQELGSVNAVINGLAAQHANPNASFAQLCEEGGRLTVPRQMNEAGENI